VVFAVTLPSVAVTVTVPLVFPVSSPCDPTVLLMVAIDELSTDHVTPLVIFDCELLLKVPVAVNCCVAVCEIVALAGVIAIDVNDGGFTVTLDDPVKPFELAEMVVLPGVMPTTKPVLVTVAMLGVLELQLAVLVMVCEFPALTVQVAVNCWVWPTPMLPVVGVTLTPVQLPVSVKKSPQPISDAPATTSIKIAISDRVLMVPQTSVALRLQDI